MTAVIPWYVIALVMFAFVIGRLFERKLNEPYCERCGGQTQLYTINGHTICRWCEKGQ